MRIAIAGAGLSGAYLYRLLKNCGLNDTITVFDRPHETSCGISPCAWGTTLGFEGLVQQAGLEPHRYAIRQHDHVMMDEMNIKTDALMINKPRLIKDLLKGAEIINADIPLDEYDRVIDATGVARAYLPRIRDDIILPCVQCRMATEPDNNDLRIKISKIGYAWSFPLYTGIHHVGAGSLVVDPVELLNDFRKDIEVNNEYREIVCSCESSVRLTAPVKSKPFVRGKIWGVGEAIGCVAPLAGEGIIPGMRSARILFDNWNDSLAYERAILKEFKWMEGERRVVDRLRRGEDLNIRSGFVLKETTKRMGMDLKLLDALKLLRRARK